MKLIIVRHGETKENKEGIIQGSIDGKLNKEGIHQAKLVAKRLKNEKIDIIYSSDLSRAHDTAKEISKYHKKTQLKTTKELRERNQGNYEGKKGSGLDWSVPAEKRGAETIQELKERAKKILQKILTKHKNRSVMFVCHGGIGKALISIITKINFKELEGLHNTSISIFEISEDKSHKIHLMNCTKHLK